MLTLDNLLLEIYNRGWHDEGDTNLDKNITKKTLDKIIKAYNLGSAYYIIGDEVSSADEITDKEILNLINE